ncbi:MAG TPA: hypothetical protein VFE06_17390 [Acidobacteriaceae bacterium]|nr:hypothetical protein [Acidobacteriaceae bacterium]
MLAGLMGWAGPLGAEVGITGAQAADAANPLNLPARTKIEVAVVRPLPAKTAKVGDILYAQTNYPVVVGDRIAIPAGTWVEGRIESVTPPSRRRNQAQVDVSFTTIIFANGYVVALPDAAPGAALPPDATEMQVTIQVSTANDLLLDNGAQIEMALAAPLTLDVEQVTAAIPLTHAPEPRSFRSATMCRTTPGSPGSPGTPDTVIPGSPGTPDTVIPGGPGMPDTVIPGTPATPDTVIPGMMGTSGTEGTVCPPTPVVLSSVPVARAAAGNVGTSPAGNPGTGPNLPH